MRKVLVALVVLLLVLSPLAIGQEAEELEKVQEVEKVEEISVLKLPYGVSVGLMPDQILPQIWYRTLDFDISQDLNTRIMRSYIGFSTGNFITDFTIGYTREFEGGGQKLEEEDQGMASFSFTWNF